MIFMVHQSTLHDDVALAILLLRLVSPFVIGKYYFPGCRTGVGGAVRFLVVGTIC